MDNLSVGFSGTSRFSGHRGRTMEGTGRGGVRYPNPFFDIGQTYLPTSMKSLLKWCRYYFLTSPLINAVVFKMSEYPITEIVIDETDPKIKKKWEDLLGQHLRYRAFQIEVGLDYFTYGSCIVTIHFPFTKYLICRGCKTKEKAVTADYKWRRMEYMLTCKKCHQETSAEVQDFNEKDVRRIRLQRWNPENVSVDPGFGGSDPVYTFQVPTPLKNDITIGKRSVLDTIPDVFIESLRRNKFIRFTDDNVFVFKRPSISQDETGCGTPLIFPVLKDNFYLQILRKAQEAIAQEHIVPLRILFPQAGSASSDPYSVVGLENWKSRVETEIQKWKMDQNYMPVLPLPIGQESIGGDGRALMLHQEMEAWSRQIVAGMGVPQEFVFGGLQYSGSNVSMRMLENSFIGYRTDHENMLSNFVIRRIANYMGWPKVSAHMRRFKMADDLQRMSLFMNLNQSMKISDQTLLQECDQDPVVEKQRRESELDSQIAFMEKQQTSQAHIQANVLRIQNKAQMEMQAEMQAMMPQPGVPGEPAAPGQPAQPGQPQPLEGQGPVTGPEGEMVPGTQVDPGMPEGSTVSTENMQQADGGLPQGAASPLTMGQKGGGAALVYLTSRAINRLKNLDEMSKQMELNKMRGMNPQLYSLVVQKLQSMKGSQEDPLNPMQSPLPEQKPSRRKAPVGT